MSNSTFNRQSFISAVKSRVEAEGATWVEVPSVTDFLSLTGESLNGEQ